jgi:ABC-type sugar transport system substrate-binding protein
MKPWVLVSLLSENQEYQRAQAAEARVAAARAGLELRIVYSNLNPALQVQQLNEAIRAPEGSRPGAVVVETAGSAGFERVARAVVEAGVGWVLVSDRSRYLEALRGEFPGKLVAAACVDNLEIGRLQAQLARALLPGGGRILAVEGPSATAAAIQRRRGLEEGLRGSTLQIGKTVTADWTTAGAAKGVDQWLRLLGKAAPKPDLVVANNDEMALGALQALRAVRPEWGKLPAIGADGLPGGGQRQVREGLLSGTVVTPATAGTGVEVAARALAGQPVPPETLVPVRPFPSLEELKRR